MDIALLEALNIHLCILVSIRCEVEDFWGELASMLREGREAGLREVEFLWIYNILAVEVRNSFL